MSTFRYALIRFVPDMVRMKPIYTVGVILQGEGKIDFKLNEDAENWKDFDADVFRQWREFFEQEIRGDFVPRFQPPKDSPEFFQYLAAECEYTVLISEPKEKQVYHHKDFDEVLTSLYNEKVLVKRTKKAAAVSGIAFKEIDGKPMPIKVSPRSRKAAVNRR